MIVAGGAQRREHILSTHAAILLATASSVIFCVFPVMLGLLARRQDLGWRALGWIGTALQLGMLIGTLAASSAVRRRRHRHGLVLGAASAALLSVLVARAGSVGEVICLEFSTGAAAGCVFGIAASVLARFAHPERNFAITLGLQAICSGGCGALLPVLEGRLGHVAAESSIAVWPIVICLVACRLSNDAVAGDIRDTDERWDKPFDLSCASALLGLMAFQAAVLTVWLYSDRLGQHWGFAAKRVDAGIAWGNLGALPAALLGAWLRDRYGHVPVAVVSTCLVIAAEGFILWPSGFACYAASQVGLNFAWTLGIAYYTGLAAKSDDRGAIMSLMPTAMVLSSALAPLCVATFGRDGEPNSLAAISIVFGAAAVALTVCSTRLRRPALAAS